MKKVLLGARWFLVTIGVIALTSVTIDATTSNSLSQSALGIMAREVTNTGCPGGMIEVSSSEKRYCIDQYEVSPDETCRHRSVTQVGQTRDNLDDPKCAPTSVKDRSPWIHVSVSQARELCARRGARLPTHQEWYDAALGVSDSARNPSCNTDSSRISKTGAFSECLSGSGAYDMIGNVWEWIDGDVTDRNFDGRVLPDTGYVHATDRAGVALETGDSANPDYHDDYFWSRESGTFVSMRGGFFGSESDAGIYSVHADIAPSFSGAAIGFRCVSDV